MNWSIIQTKKEYENVLKRIDELSENPPALRSDEGRELLLLGYLADQYEETEFPIQNPKPIDAIKVRMEQLSLKPADLMDIFGDRGTASKVLNGQRSMSLSMIRLLAEKLSLPVSLLIQPTTVNKHSRTKKSNLQVSEPKATYKKGKR
jgi:HTH-type transcriptional regulator / antitoxin HigA